MDKEIIHIQTKRVEKTLSRVTARLAAAEALLIDAQEDIDALYVTLDETEDPKEEE